MSKPPPNATTWTAVGLIALGLIMIYLAWNGVAGGDAARDLRAQFPYLISGGVFGLALIGAGLTLVRVYEARKDAKELLGQLQRLTESVDRLVAARVVDPMLDHPGGPSALHPASHVLAGGAAAYDRASTAASGAARSGRQAPPLAPPPPPFERAR